MPRHTAYPSGDCHTLLPNTQHTLQEAALQPRDFKRPPYSPERLPYGQGLPYSPQHTQHTLPSGIEHTQECTAYPAMHKRLRLQDYKTVNQHQPVRVLDHGIQQISNKVRVFMLRVQIKVAMAWVSRYPPGSWIENPCFIA